MNSNVFIWIGIIAVSLAAVVYFVVLPHLEGPSLDEQRPQKRSWLVKCPHCGVWEQHVPLSSSLAEADREDANTYTNWYRCEACQHRWEETYKR